LGGRNCRREEEMESKREGKTGREMLEEGGGNACGGGRGRRDGRISVWQTSKQFCLLVCTVYLLMPWKN
jgi:hypothetical protein